MGERHHRRLAARLLPNEDREKQYAGAKRRDHQRVAPAAPGRRDQSIDQAAEASERQQRAAPVETGCGLRITAFRHVAERDPDRRQRDERIDEEDPAPRGVIHDPSAEQRAERRRHCRKSRPGADRLAALAFIERRTDDRERTRDQQRRARALDGARNNQLRDVGAQPAPQRSGRKD
jgi:hypothetical protein